MNILDIQQLKFSIGDRDLLNIQNLQATNGQKIGLIGRNGSGKSTLLNVLNQETVADDSHFSVRGNVELLPQLKPTHIKKSGGEITQDYIVRLLSKNPQLLLADEPTTNLDTSHIKWVERELKRFNGALILVSHDRQLLDNVCETIWELEDGEITQYTGNYSNYVEQKRNKEKFQEKEYQKYQAEKKKIEEAITQKQQQAQQAGKAPKNKSYSEINAKGAQTYYGKLQKGLHQNQKAMESRLEKLDPVEKPKEKFPIQMDLPDVQTYKNKIILRAENMSGQINSKKLWKPTTFFIKGSDKVGIIGPNGSGKTTFVRKIINDNDKNLYRSPAMKIGYFAQDLNILDNEKTILENVKRESKQTETLIRIVLARLGFYQNDVEKKVKVLSGGERVKVSLAKIFVSDCNTLILDEPTNFLDVYALEALEELLVEYEGTVLILSHDRSFISSVATKILAFEDNELIFFEGTYEEYLNRDQENERDIKADELARLENEIAAVLSQLSIEPTDELDKKFQELIKKKREIEN